MKKVLFFAAWYPNRYDAMAGLFVRKHAEAVSKYVDVCVLFPYADENVYDFDVEIKKNGSVTEICVYYPFVKNRYCKTLSKAINYFRAFNKGYKEVVEYFGKPDVTHTHVLTRAGVFSFFLWKTKKIPYVITEQWSRYFSVKASYKGFFRKRITELIVKHASAVLPVSSLLEKAMKENSLHNDNYHVIGNVVDDFFYDYQEKQKRDLKRILHVSCFDDNAKNISGILRAIHKLSDERFDFELIVVGVGPDYEKIVKEARNLELLDTVVYFVGEKTPEQVSEWMKQSDFFVLFSNFETFATVIPESLACGRPVITSNVGISQNCITEKNGKIVPCGDEHVLCETINWMLDHFQEYNESEIRNSARKFCFSEIGSQINSIYEQI